MNLQNIYYNYFVIGYQQGIFDNPSYLDSGVQLGWITQDQAKRLKQAFYPEEQK